MRIFEDEIIKRIKIIQSFVKGMDGKINRVRQKQKQQEQQYIKGHYNQLSGSRNGVINTSNLDESDQKRPPERLRDLLDDQAPLGAATLAQQQLIKEAVKWEAEIIERKTEERFKEFELLLKKIGSKVDQNATSIVEETQSEFQNIKAQFEEFGNSVYQRVDQEFQDKITIELSKSLTDLQRSLNNDLAAVLNAQTKPFELKIMSLESQCEELRVAQEQALEELNKYQDNIERIIEQNQE